MKKVLFCLTLLLLCLDCAWAAELPDSVKDAVPPGGAAISVLSKPPADHSGTSCHNPRTWRLIRTTAEEISRRAVPPSPLTATVPHRPMRKPPRPIR